MSDMVLGNGESVWFTNGPIKIPIQERPDGSVIFDPAAMEPGRPYPYRLGGSWLVAVARPGGSINVYSTPEPTVGRLVRWAREVAAMLGRGFGG